MYFFVCSRRLAFIYVSFLYSFSRDFEILIKKSPCAFSFLLILVFFLLFTFQHAPFTHLFRQNDHKFSNRSSSTPKSSKHSSNVFIDWDACLSVGFAWRLWRGFASFLFWQSSLQYVVWVFFKVYLKVN